MGASPPLYFLLTTERANYFLLTPFFKKIVTAGFKLGSGLNRSCVSSTDSWAGL